MRKERPRATTQELQADLDLASRIMSGDNLAFEELYEATHRKTFGLCNKMLRDPDLAEDICQQIYVQIWRKIHTYNGTSRLTTWIHRIIINQVLMHLRKAKAEKLINSLDTITSLKQTISIQSVTRKPVIDLMIDLERAIAKLPNGYRKTFLLKEYTGLEHQEIALVTGKCEGNSKSQLSKAKAKLKKLLLKEANERLPGLEPIQSSV